MNGSIEDVIRSRREKAAMRRDYISLILRVIFVALVGYILFAQLFLITQAKGNEMFPAVKDGDLIIGFRLQKDFVKKDIAVYEMDGERHISRVIALEGDVVTLDDGGALVVNGTTQSGEIFYPTYAGEALEYPYRVPPDSMFVLGDRRTDAEDSRDFGPVPMKQVEAKVITILRRRGL